MLRYLLMLLMCVCLNTRVYAQNRSIDSLQALIKTDKEDTLKIIHLNELGTRYFYISNYTMCMQYATQALKLSLLLHYTHGISVAYNKIGIANNSIGNYPLALKNYYLALKYTDDKRKILYYKEHIIDNIAGVLGMLGKYNQALNMYNKSLKTYQLHNDTLSYINTYYNIGVLYDHMEQDSMALNSFMRALHYTTHNTSKHTLASVHSYIAASYANMRNYNQAKKYCNMGMNGFMLQKNQTGIALCYGIYSQINIEQGNGAVAIWYLNKTLAINLATKSKESIANTYLNLYEAHYNMHNYATALKYYKLHIVYEDSIHNSAAVEKTTQLTMQYQFDKQQQAQAYTQQLKDKATTTQWIVVLASIVTLMLLVFSVLMYLRFVQKQHALTLSNQLSEMELQVLRLQINPHFMFNALNSIYSLITSNATNKAETYLIKFSRILRSTLNQSAHEFITLQEELATLIDYIDLEQLRLNHSFIYSITPHSSLTQTYKIPPLVLQPFVENAILHGLKPLKYAGTLSIDISQTNTTISIAITDNGIGRKESAALQAQKTTVHNSKGIAITTQRIIALRSKYPQASIEIKDNTDANGNALGTTVMLLLPVIK
jgi:hypothetical protein